jgi:Flp pilus assembly secretin CpaC
MLGRAAALIAVGMTMAGMAIAHEAMFVEQGGAKMLKLNAPATDVIVADPSVVDVSVQTQNQIVLIGKKYGTTQIMILSGDTVLLDSEVVVSTANQDSSVSVFAPGGRGGIAERSYACYKRCATSQLVSSSEGAGGQTISVTLGEAGGATTATAQPAPAGETGEAPAQ